MEDMDSSAVKNVEWTMSDMPVFPVEVPLHKATLVSVDWLKLDAENPRLMGVRAAATDEAIIAHLYRAEDLGELLQSIAANGYMDVEPFIVLQGEEHLTVLEGNRRLAAVRLFREPDLVSRISKSNSIKIPVPKLSEGHERTLCEISVYRVAKREDADSFIGFKHINGAARWSSYAKARFAARWHKDQNVSLTDISNRIGDRHATVKRMVNAIYVLDQAAEEGIFDIDDRKSPRFSFSHLYTALARPDYRKFLGLEAKWAGYDPKPNPVPSDKKNRLKEVLTWLYGSKSDDLSPVVQSQNPDIRNLGAVLESAEGLAVLRASRSLSEARISAQPAGPRFMEALYRARKEIREVFHNVRGFDGKDITAVNLAEDISETAQAIHERMKKKVETARLSE